MFPHHTALADKRHGNHLKLSRPSYAALVPFAILATIAVIYLPVVHASFVWDDKIFLLDTAWLSHGSDWIGVVLHGFSDWTSYFRPLGIAFWVVEARTLDLSAGPMHVVSLCIHLLNTLLVGVLARLLARVATVGTPARFAPALSMLFFGLHPVLVEPVVWIASQFELLLTFFTLLGLILNFAIANTAGRVAAVAACFFLAACTKETAFSVPLLFAIFDWMRRPAGKESDRPGSSRAHPMRVQLPIYAALLVAGVAYLAFRSWGLGFLVPNQAQDPLPYWSRFQQVCFTYVSYWKLIVWPMSGLGPLHFAAAEKFAGFTLEAMSFDMGALMILAGGVCLLARRNPLGALIVAGTVPLLPVLHIIPISFDDSLFHDRYAMTAVAMVCVFLPFATRELVVRQQSAARLALFGKLICALWLLVAIVNIRATVPLWSDEVRLWQWALRQNPGSYIAADNLLSAYLDRNDVVGAEPLVQRFMASKRLCVNCMLNVAQYAIDRGDAGLADAALERASHSLENAKAPRRLKVMYLVATAGAHRLRHEWSSAEDAYRAAIALDPLDPNPPMNLAIMLAKRGMPDAAGRAADAAIALYPPGERQARRSEFETVLAASTQTALDAVSRQPDR